MGWFSKKKEFPDATDVAVRALVLRCVVSYANQTPTPEAIEDAKIWWTEAEKRDYLKEFNRERDAIWQTLGKYKKYLTPKERSLSQTSVITISNQEIADSSWRVEALGVLLWALGFVDRILSYDESTGPEFIGKFWSVEDESFVRTARLRSRDEIALARDIAESWHWRSRTRQICEDGTPFPDDPSFREAGFFSFDDIVRKTSVFNAEEGMFEAIEEDYPAFGKAYRDLSDEEWSTVRSITMERHFALNWLCGYSPGHKWDETPTDT